VGKFISAETQAEFRCSRRFGVTEVGCHRAIDVGRDGLPT
jgi:hypothetical protein